MRNDMEEWIAPDHIIFERYDNWKREGILQEENRKLLAERDEARKWARYYKRAWEDATSEASTFPIWHENWWSTE